MIETTDDDLELDDSQENASYDEEYDGSRRANMGGRGNDASVVDVLQPSTIIGRGLVCPTESSLLDKLQIVVATLPNSANGFTMEDDPAD